VKPVQQAALDPRARPYRRKQCGKCSDESCPKCRYRAFQREYNRRRRLAGRRLFPLDPDELRIRTLIRELTGQDPAPPKTKGHQCFDLNCQICQAAEEASSRAREKRAELLGCRCGQLQCDCARWERIYREKFEDPTYYERNATGARSSPFSDF